MERDGRMLLTLQRTWRDWPSDGAAKHSLTGRQTKRCGGSRAFRIHTKRLERVTRLPELVNRIGVGGYMYLMLCTDGAGQMMPLW